MDHLIFEWNDEKSSANKNKHGISFEEAKNVLDDQFARLIADPDHSNEEDRFILLGMSTQARLLVVSHFVRVNESIRIISVRRADRQERNIYERYRYA